MFVRFSSLPHGFELLEGHIHDQDDPLNGEVKMPRSHDMPFTQKLILDPKSPWGTLDEFQTSTSHHIH
jgi:hypothetical protein